MNDAIMKNKRDYGDTPHATLLKASLAVTQIGLALVTLLLGCVDVGQK